MERVCTRLEFGPSVRRVGGKAIHGTVKQSLLGNIIEAYETALTYFEEALSQDASFARLSDQ